MSSSELRKKFLEFFKKKGHAIVPSSSLIPDDPSVLLTTAGMQQFKKYYTGEAEALRDFGSKNTVSVQKSFRTSDIDEVGDDSHLTFFEMLGNFSFGGYFKKEAIEYAHEFITKELGLKIDFVSVFGGEKGILADEESEKIWKKIDSEIEVKKFGRKDNFWGPTGGEGPCGPTTEIYIDGVEIWNIVFNEYYQRPDGSLEKLETPGVDTGMGLERLAMVSQGKKNIFETDLFAPFMESLPGGTSEKQKRIIVDHLRGSAFLLADGVRPSNKEAGYVLRRLIRRTLAYENIHKISEHVFNAVFHDIVHEYGNFYNELLKKADSIRREFTTEHEKFSESFSRGLAEFNKRIMVREPQDRFGRVGKFHDQKILYGDDAFYIYQTFGFPREVMKDLALNAGGSFDDAGFDQALKKHQEISRAGQEKKFGGHGLLLNTGELKAKDEEELKKVTRLHTATHLLQAALRKILGEEVKQMGSDITAERLRFDFSFPRKLTKEELEKVEDLVNDAVSKKLEMKMEEMDLEDAKKSGALYFFKEKYPAKVKIYSAGNFSKELCGGPHVKNTSEVGKFVILKEEAVGAGARRIRGVVK